MKHKSWAGISPGDIVDIIAPGYPSPPEQVTGGIHFLRSWGLVPRAPRQLIQKHFLHANSDEKRFDFLRAALLAPDSKIVWCTRGGYGSNRLLPELKKLKKPPKNKLLIGLSDITSLHSFLNQEWGWSTLHACVLDRLGRGELPVRLQKELRQILFGEVRELVFRNLKSLNAGAEKVSTRYSQVVGGNLTVLQGALGTPFQIKTKDSLLFIEDTGERGYRIDRMLEQFRQAGLFQDCHGILLGHFIGGAEPKTGKDNFRKVFSRWAGDLEIPLWSGIEAGHDTNQRALPLFTDCKIARVGNRHHLTLETGGVFKK